MNPTPVIAIFDIGKTNKKFFLFDEEYKIVFEKAIQFPEIKDEDGDACDDVQKLSDWVMQTLKNAIQSEEFNIRAVNFSAYGASFVYADKDGNPLTPLFNYLKKYPEILHQQFYNKYGGEEKISVETASPVLESLNSGLQVYRLKYQHPDIFDKTAFAFHLPQYISYLISDLPATDITSIGCHTALWDYQENKYHQWVIEEQIDHKFAPILPSSTSTNISFADKKINAGIGLHDSSSALIPYLASFSEPFILISTGTWCISLNPFNSDPLTPEELKQDCLCYMAYNGRPVKASRLFAGNEHEQQTKSLAQYFNVAVDHYKKVSFDADLIDFDSLHKKDRISQTGSQKSLFQNKNLSDFVSYEQAYHQLIVDIILQQYAATSSVLNKKCKKIFVDGGFAKNPVYMNLLASVFPNIEVFAASVSQASAMGAALAIHKDWNTKPIPDNLIELKYY